MAGDIGYDKSTYNTHYAAASDAAATGCRYVTPLLTYGHMLRGVALIHIRHTSRTLRLIFDITEYATLTRYYATIAIRCLLASVELHNNSLRGYTGHIRRA